MTPAALESIARQSPLKKQRFSIARYRRSDRERVFEMIRETQAPQAAARLVRQWDWKFDNNPLNAEAENYRRANRRDFLSRLRRQYLDNEIQIFLHHWGDGPELLRPERDDDPYLLLLKDRGEKVVGILGAMPYRVAINGSAHWASVACDWIVRRDYRRRGWGPSMGMRWRGENPLYFSWANAAAEKHLLRHERSLPSKSRDSSTGADHRRLTPWVKPLDRSILTRHARYGRLAGVAGAMLIGATGFLGRILQPNPISGASVAEIESFGERFDSLWERCRGDYGVIGVRDSSYLTWRFSSRPDARYTVLVVSLESRLIGYIVVRISDIDGAKWGYMVDYLVENRSTQSFSMLLSAAERFLLQRKVEGIVCSVTSSPFRGALFRRGFLPALFRTSSYLDVLRNHEDSALADYSDLRRWFVTMADGDLEMAF